MGEGRRALRRMLTAPAAACGGCWGWACLVCCFCSCSSCCWAGKTVHFETGCDSKVKDQKVKKGSLVTRPEQPVRPGRAFAGWYADESCTKRWDFDNDKVEDNMTLYAKWL